MDRGAARSRKRAAKLSKAAEPVVNQPTSKSRTAQSQGGSSGGWKKEDHAVAGPSRPRAPLPSQEDSRPRKGTGTAQKPKKIRKVPSDDPNQYKPKAIRNSTALIYAATTFPIPPPKDRLQGVTRIDLAGSECDDVSWLEGTGVTWLSLKGCTVRDGWEAVGRLADLAVLNISECGLKSLPKSLKGLRNLKAVVAMNNPWETLDGEVLSSWTQLNSLIISHSPNLRSLPSDLTDLHHLSKLTFSHCPRLTAKSLPDLSYLPLLRDVKMNNLPQLTSLPTHISTWGTGDLSLVKTATDSSTGDKRTGDGLEVLDLGNCSLDWTTISTTFGLSGALKGGKPSASWKHLRSLTLHSNPFVSAHPDYAELLQQSVNLPKLQIIDSKRVIERKHAGQLPETKYERLKKERKERKYGKSDEGYKQRPKIPNPAAAISSDASAKATKALEALDEQKQATKKGKDSDDLRETKATARSTAQPLDGVEKKRKRDEFDKPHDKRPKRDSRHSNTKTSLPPQHLDTSDPSLIHSSSKRDQGTESAVMQVIDIPRDLPKDAKRKDKAPKEKKGKDGKVVTEVKSQGGIDLRQVFSGAKKDDDPDEGTGLGVGGW